jgi:hypothetical protein
MLRGGEGRMMMIVCGVVRPDMCSLTVGELLEPDQGCDEPWSPGGFCQCAWRLGSS